jgi:hypothetical protein
MITSEDITELQKVKNLVEHFEEHQAKQPGLAFFELIEIHYGKDRNTEKQDKHSDELPFQSHHCCNSGIAFYTNASYPFQINIFPSEIKNKPTYKIEMPSSSSSSIWQPPKFSC